MKKIIFGFIIGLVFINGIGYAYRISKPLRIVDFDQKGLIVINENFERLWDITNGRFSLNEGANSSTGTGTIKMGSTSNANSTGFLKIEKTDGTVVYIPYFSDDTP